MSSGTPYIGSKISLISKAEIRYEGVLYDVDSKEATVTLSKVKSYGTENRRAIKHIPPRNEVYEYIIFRGSDIKDLSVSEMGNRDEEPHLDPAIVSAQTAPPTTTSRSSDLSSNLRTTNTTTSNSSSILPTPPVQPATGGYTQFPPPGLGAYNPFGYFGRAPPPPMMMGLPMQQHAAQINQPSQTPPNHISTISSAMNSSSQAGSTNNSLLPPSLSEGTQKATTRASQDTTMPITGLSNVGQPFSAPPQVNTSQQSQPRDNPSVSTPQAAHKGDSSPKQSVSKHEDKKSSPVSPASSNEETKSKPKRGPRRDGQKYANYTPRGGSNYRGQRGGGVYRSSGWERPAGNTGNHPTPNRPPSSTTTRSNPNSQPLKYTKDFDFESANALFSKDQLEEEMKSKLRISDDQSKVGGSNSEDVLEDSESPEQELEEGELEEEEQGNNSEGFYNKSRSFFDNISCEATQSNSNRRANRSQEMALNTETFGVANSRNYNRSFRGNQGRGYNSRYRGGRGRYNQYNGYNSYNRGGYQRGRGNGGYYRGSGSGTRNNESSGRNHRDS